MTQDLIEERDDWKRALVRHQPSGELYLVEYCSLWTPRTTDSSQTDDSQCIGSRIYAVCGPVVARDVLGPDHDLLEPARDIFERIRDWEGNFTEDDAAWLQAEEEAGRLQYPIGVA